MIRKLLTSVLKHNPHDQLRVAINMEPTSGPYGGGNQFVSQLSAYLRENGHKVYYKLMRGLTHIVLIDPRPFKTIRFGLEDIRAYKEKHPEVVCIHRINECDMRKGTNNVDDMLREANRLADHTVFISEWLRDYFIDRWFSFQSPHSVIQNGADNSIFFSGEPETFPIRPFRIVTHHWSKNWKKGFRVYKQVDDLIADGLLAGFELRVIGNWPEEITWRSAVTYPPTAGRELADLLRENHAYLTASEWEPCGMHHVEGAQCGLPLIYHCDGGGIVEFGKRYGIEFEDDVKSALKQMRDQYSIYRQKVLEAPPSGARMCREFMEVLLCTLPKK